MEQVLETLALLADAILQRNRQAVDEDLVRVHRRPAHLLDLAHLHVVPIEIRIEE